MRYAIIVTLLLLSGCYHAMSNDQIIAAHNKCLAVGMRPAQIENSWTGEVLLVVCKEKDKP